jgi:(+)-trans-carveol dehydrogenase
VTGRVEGKVAFITGAARGQGRSHALRLAEEGADIIGLDICRQIPSVPYALASPEDLDETISLVEKQGRRMVGVQGDVRDYAAVSEAVQQGVSAFGRLDIVSANAGIFSSAPSHELTSEAWCDMIDTQLTGVWHACKAAIPVMKTGGRGGAIVITSSAAGLKGNPNTSHYVAAKHGVVGLMRSLALELAPDFIRVNTIHPTTVRTDMITNDAMYALFRPDLEAPGLADVEASFVEFNALPIQWIEPIDVSNALLFLVSDEARYITGAALPVDAGCVLH